MLNAFIDILPQLLFTSSLPMSLKAHKDFPQAGRSSLEHNPDLQQLYNVRTCLNEAKANMKQDAVEKDSNQSSLLDYQWCSCSRRRRDLGGQPPDCSRTATGARTGLFLLKGIMPGNGSWSSNVLENALEITSYLDLHS